MSLADFAERSRNLVEHISAHVRECELDLATHRKNVVIRAKRAENYAAAAAHSRTRQRRDHAELSRDLEGLRIAASKRRIRYCRRELDELKALLKRARAQLKSDERRVERADERRKRALESQTMQRLAKRAKLSHQYKP